MNIMPGFSRGMLLHIRCVQSERVLRMSVAAETVPVPVELCPFVCQLDESVAPQPVETPHRVPSARDVTADRRHPSVPHAVTSRRPAPSAGGGTCVAMAAVARRHQQQMTSRHVTRKSLQRANRVNEHLSRCPRQRRYNYKLCYGERQRRAF